MSKVEVHVEGSLIGRRHLMTIEERVDWPVVVVFVAIIAIGLMAGK